MDAPARPPAVLARFTLRVAGRPLEFAVEVPAGEVTLLELLPALFSFHAQLQAALVNQEEAQGRSVSCRAGCGACCRQLVPIGRVEAALLRQWLADRPADEQAQFRARFAAAREQLARAGLTERLARRAALASAEETRRLGLDYFTAGVACPFLVDESCRVHPVRPMKCREYLVTSPAAHCANPGPETIAMVPFPASFLRILLRFEAEQPTTGPAWLPLVDLLEDEPAPSSSPDASPRRPGPEWFQQFVRSWAASA